MKTPRFFPAIAAVAGAITVGLIARLTADKVAENGGMKQTFDKMRDGAAAVIDATKQHPVVTWAAGNIAALRERVVANDDRAAIGTTADVSAVIQPALEAPAGDQDTADKASLAA